MTKPQSAVDDTLAIVELCRGQSAAVAMVVDLGRCLWAEAFGAPPPPSPKAGRKARRGPPLRRLDQKKLRDAFLASPACQRLNKRSDKTKLFELIHRQLGATDRFRPRAAVYDREVFQPLDLVYAVLPGMRVVPDLKYLVRKAIREHYQCSMTSETVQGFHLLAEVTNGLLASIRGEQRRSDILRHVLRNESLPRHSRQWAYATELRPILLRCLEVSGNGNHPTPEARGQVLDLYIEVCRMVGFLRATFGRGYVELRTSQIDAEYLLANLFGLPTSIRGLDELFGGGGVMLWEDSSKSHLERRGRLLLIRGNYGSGKTLLSLQLAVEVARKGGIAWVMLLEQEPGDCRYILETVRTGDFRHSYTIIDDVRELPDHLDSQEEDQGLVILLGSRNRSFEELLEIVRENHDLMEPGYALRLLVVDPLTSELGEQTGAETGGDGYPRNLQRRAHAVEVFQKLKDNGTNVLLVSEEDRERSQGEVDISVSLAGRGLSFADKIADTVVHLFSRKRHGYLQRYIELTKSRFQREQRGEHPFSIVPGRGFHILPSSASVNARMRGRGSAPERRFIRFGLPGLDEIIGDTGLMVGDTILLDGPTGSFKAPLGIVFLLGSDYHDVRSHAPEAFSLLISARDDRAILQRRLEEAYVRKHAADNLGAKRSRKGPRHIRICELPRGYVHPGYVFQALGDEFKRAREDGQRIDRVMIDTVSHWELSAPFIREDITFADTLVAFLRRNRVTSLFCCELGETHGPWMLQRCFEENADCRVQFTQSPIGVGSTGGTEVFLSVVRSRHGRHVRSEPHLLELNASGRFSLSPLPVDPEAAVAPEAAASMSEP